MSDIFRIKNISTLNEVLNQEKPKHPLISIADFSKIDFKKTFKADKESMFATDFYIILLKNLVPGSLKYGRNYYDFQDGSLFFISPNQVFTIEDPDNKEEVYGWGLFFHPDLIRSTSLNSKMKEYTFFSYALNEALHLSDKEKNMLGQIIESIDQELNRSIDKHSKAVIVSTIELLLNHCMRYYDRQFITRTEANKDVITIFEDFLTSYFNSDKPQTIGLPNVKLCADEVSLSPNYLSDLLKKETGKSTQDHIHYHVLELAKDKLLSSSASVSEIAYNLGFEYPQYFSKLFKSKIGMSPAKFRNVN